MASRRSRRGEFKFASASVGAREQRAARCDGPHTAVRARSARRHRLVPLRCSTSIVLHSCGCFAAVNSQAELRAAFLRAVFALVAVKVVRKRVEQLETINEARRDAGTHGRAGVLSVFLILEGL